ncbi:hypothetical protein EGT09_05675 [Pseudomonas putida]|nr:hypothetical protein EGT09_05675 [Pseudomonas putida]
MIFYQRCKIYGQLAFKLEDKFWLGKISFKFYLIQTKVDIIKIAMYEFSVPIFSKVACSFILLARVTHRSQISQEYCEFWKCGLWQIVV